LPSFYADELAPSADDILAGLKDFYRKTARPDDSSLAISPTGFFAAGIRNGDTQIWPAKWSSPIDDIVVPGHGDMCAVAFSRYGNWLATSAGDWNRSGAVRLYTFDNAGNAMALRFRLPHTGEITSIAFSPTHLAAGAADKTVRIWPLPNE